MAKRTRPDAKGRTRPVSRKPWPSRTGPEYRTAWHPASRDESPNEANDAERSDVEVLNQESRNEANVEESGSGDESRNEANVEE